MRALSFLGLPVHPPASQLALLDPQLRCHLGIVATHLLDEPLRVLAPNEHFELDAEGEIGRAKSFRCKGHLAADSWRG